MRPNPLIFIVDDDEFIHKLIRSLLERFSLFYINHYYSGEECIKGINKSPDVVLLDYEMDGINGLETLEKIKNNNPDIPVYLISSQKETTLAAKAIKKGAKDYFTKDNSLSGNLKKVFSSPELYA